MCRSMVDIRPATAEIRRGKKEERKKQDKNIMSASATQGGHKKVLPQRPWPVQFTIGGQPVGDVNHKPSNS